MKWIQRSNLGALPEFIGKNGLGGNGMPPNLVAVYSLLFTT